MTSTPHHAASPDYWRNRWQEGATGWHQDGINGQLMKWWPQLGLDQQAPVLVPLCGASQDLRWLASQGHEVYGAEASEQAIKRFFDEAKVDAVVHPLADTRLEVHEAGSIHIFCGDYFDITTSLLPPLAAAYDRAAIVALPPELRPRYLQHLHQLLAPGATVLLLSFEYPQQVKDGPPFSVEQEEIRRLADGLFTVQQLDRLDLHGKEPRFADPAYTYVFETVYRLERLP